MGESLGKCRICGNEAGALYPLLPGSPAFCHAHHNSRDAGRFGCDFTGPDDFDIPDDLGDGCGDPDILSAIAALVGHRPKPIVLNRKKFIWTDIQGNQHKLKDINDNYLGNIIRFLEKRIKDKEVPEHYNKLINFLKNEQYRRISGG